MQLFIILTNFFLYFWAYYLETSLNPIFSANQTNLFHIKIYWDQAPRWDSHNTTKRKV